MDHNERKQAILDQGKHSLSSDFFTKERAFFHKYDENMSPEVAAERYGGMYGTDKDEVLPKRKLEKIWRKFLLQERIDYIVKNNTVSIEDIVNIGIDKFIRTNGWEKAADVPTWRNNVVRVGICPECKDQFIPLIMQTNHGLCKNCRPNFSGKAIKRFVEHVISTSPRYFRAHQDALMDFYIMFYNDSIFRKMFIKDSPTAIEIEEREFELPEWLEEEQEKDLAVAQQRMLDMIPQSDPTDEK